jgi:phosphoglycolate phosphatase-like HAD superfamily hydrolase
MGNRYIGMMTHLIIFDLDGTLADTRTDIAYTVNLTRACFDLMPLPLEQIISYMGNGSKKLAVIWPS